MFILCEQYRALQMRTATAEQNDRVQPEYHAYTSRDVDIQPYRHIKLVVKFTHVLYIKRGLLIDSSVL